MQVQCALMISPVSWQITQGVSGVAVILCECFTYTYTHTHTLNNVILIILHMPMQTEHQQSPTFPITSQRFPLPCLNMWTLSWCIHPAFTKLLPSSIPFQAYICMHVQWKLRHMADICKLALSSSRVYGLGVEIMYMNISLHATSGIASGSSTQDSLGMA